MRRRLDLAASFVLAPRVLFLDEPTVGQDPRHRNEVWEVVRSLVAEGTTVLLTTHYLDEADQLADSISVIDHGRVIAVRHAGGAEGARRRLADRRRRRRRRRCRSPRPRSSGSARASPAVDADARRITRPPAIRSATLSAVLRALEDVGVDAPRTSRCAARRSTRCSCTDRRVPRRWRHDRALQWAVLDTWTITRRDLIQWVVQPVRIVGELVFPIMFVLLFGYVFGSGMVVPGGGDYREFLMPGLFAMTMAFGIGNTMTVVATDIERGVMDRFRSMPMSPSAVVAGRCTADMINSFVGLPITIACGLVVGWSWHDGLG